MTDITETARNIVHFLISTWWFTSCYCQAETNVNQNITYIEKGIKQ